jgi:hypothetical protein
MKTTPWTIQDCAAHAQREANRAEHARRENPNWDTEREARIAVSCLKFIRRMIGEVGK